MIRIKTKTALEKIREFQRSDPENKVCVECGEPGPTDLCVPYGTFICMTCSGIHREFNRRIRGLTVSEWTEADVEYIQARGNRKNLDEFMETSRSKPFATNQDAKTLRTFFKDKYDQLRWKSKAEIAPRSPKKDKEKMKHLYNVDEDSSHGTKLKHHHHRRKVSGELEVVRVLQVQRNASADAPQEKSKKRHTKRTTKDSGTSQDLFPEAAVDPFLELDDPFAVAETTEALSFVEDKSGTPFDLFHPPKPPVLTERFPGDPFSFDPKPNLNSSSVGPEMVIDGFNSGQMDIPFPTNAISNSSVQHSLDVLDSQKRAIQIICPETSTSENSKPSFGFEDLLDEFRNLSAKDNRPENLPNTTNNPTPSEPGNNSPFPDLL